MAPWVNDAICRRLPPEWWETGDDGNRLALMLCNRACPVRGLCALGDERPCGVVRAGVAYSERGRALAVCECGRPVVRVVTDNPQCQACDPEAPKALWVRAYWRERARARRGALAVAA